MARVIVSDGTTQKEYELVDAITVAGRSTDNRIPIDDRQASRKHCQFEKTDYGYKLVDLESRNGTRVNDRVVNQALLRPGDKVMIGKHTLTFEDAGFREPPAEIAARFAPPVPNVPTPEPAARPAAAPSPVPSPTEPERRSRRRTSSGNTTAMIVQRTERFERAREQQMLRWVGVAAGLFIAILVVLIVLPGGNAPVEKAAAPRTNPAEAKRSAEAVEMENRDFEALSEFCEKNRSTPTNYDRIVSMCTDFKKKYPGSLSLPKVESYLKAVADARRSTRGKELEDGLSAAREEAKKGRFAVAVKQVNALLPKSTDDVEAHDRLVKAHDEIVDQAKEHFQARRTEAKDLAAAGKKDEAAQVYEALVASLGDGSVEELSVWSQIAKTALSGLK